MKLRQFPLAALACILLFATISAASPITVNNASFEILPLGGLPDGGCGVGCSFSVAAIPGWVNTGNSGQFQPGPSAGNFAYYNSIPDGITIAYDNGGTISQTTAATVQLGVTYTLMVDLGFRKDYEDPGAIALLIGSTPFLATGGGVQFSGDWATYTATYTGLAADVGQTIGIELSSPGTQGEWDNVRLNDSTTVSGVPEPLSLLLLGSGLAGLGLIRRRR